MFEQKTEDEKGISIPFAVGLAHPVMEIRKHFRDFLLLTGLVSFICSVVSLIVGHSFFCGVLNESFCSTGVVSFAVSSLVMLWGLGFYVSRWTGIVFEGFDFVQAIKCQCFKRDLKAMGSSFLGRLFFEYASACQRLAGRIGCFYRSVCRYYFCGDSFNEFCDIFQIVTIQEHYGAKTNFLADI